VRQDGREEAEEDGEAGAERRDGRAVARARAALRELEERVREVGPEEGLRLLERVRVVELVEGVRDAPDQRAEARDERAVELGGHGGDRAGLLEDVLP